MKTLRVMFAAVVVTTCAAACVGLSSSETKVASAKPGSPEELIRAVVTPRVPEGSKIDSIKKTPYGGLYEVQVGAEVFYADPTGKYVFLGNVLDAKTQENLTDARVQDLLRIDFKDLPLNLAQKVVRGNGERVMAVFADPNCGYCKRLEQEMVNIDNVTIYTFLFPVLGEDSLAKSRQIACAADVNAAWDNWMLRGAAPSGEGTCKNPIDETLAYGRKLKINGTPTLFFADGKRIPGLIPTDQIVQLLDRNKQPGSRVATVDAAIVPQATTVQ
ncbi:DsbC family protein [soil metagenome]